MKLLPLAIACALLGACSKPSTSTTTPPTDGEAPPKRPALSAADCEGQGGTVVGDIGDGAIHRPEYVCESGSPPLGDIQSMPGAPAPIEGAVCCK